MHFSISAHLMRVGGAEVEGDEGEPDDAGCVHREPDELGLVEVLRHLPGLDGVEGAHRDQNHAVHLRADHGLSTIELETRSAKFSQSWRRPLTSVFIDS